MIGLAPATVAWPLLAAIVLALLPATVGARVPVMAGRLASLGTMTLAGLALWSPATGGQPWLDDRLSVSLALLAAVAAMLAAAMPAARGGGALQLATGGAILACRAESLMLMLVGLGLMLGGVEREWRGAGMRASLAGLLLAGWLGAALLAAGLGVPAGWTGLGAGWARMDPAIRLCGQLLLLLPMLLLAWLGSCGPVLRMDAPGAGVRVSWLLAIPALGVALRLRGLQAPDPLLALIDLLALAGGGLLALLLSLALMPGRRLPERAILAAGAQLGAAAIGFGVGGTGGIAAGLMLLLSATLLLPLALGSAERGAARGTRTLAVLALAGLPPFVPFAAGFVLLLRLSAAMPLLVLPVLAALIAVGLSLLSELRARPEAAVRSGGTGRMAALHRVPGMVVLALLFWLGLAMPGALSDWMLGMSETFAGEPGTAAP